MHHEKSKHRTGNGTPTGGKTAGATATPETGKTRGKVKEMPKQRAVRRCPLVASAEVTDVASGTRLSARTSELGVGGCYIETLNPFPEGALVDVRIVRDQGVFEAKAKVVYTHNSFGMGLAFSEVTPEKRSLLEDWLAEIVTQLRPVS